MEHAVRVLMGPQITEASWDHFYQELKSSEGKTSKELAQVRNARDFSVTTENRQSWKQAQGDFKNPIHGIRSVTRYGDDLIVCVPHLDINQDVETDSGRKLQQVYTTYRPREARAVNPRQYSKPFYFRLFTGNPKNEVVILLPTALPNATEYVLRNEILPKFGKGVQAVERAFPENPFVFIEAVENLERLERVQSVSAMASNDGESPTEINHSFPSSAGALRDFKGWCTENKRSYGDLSLTSVRLKVTLKDLEGTDFEVVLRPHSVKPLSITVAQKSDSVASAYRLVTDVLHKVLGKPVKD